MPPPPPEPVPGCPRSPHPSPPRFRAVAAPQGTAAGSGVGVSLLSSLPACFFLVFQAQIGKRGGPEHGPSQLPLAAAPAAPWLLRLPAPSFLPSPFICFGAGPRESLPAPQHPAVGLGPCGMPCPKPPAQEGGEGKGCPWTTLFVASQGGLAVVGMRPRCPAPSTPDFSSSLACS